MPVHPWDEIKHKSTPEDVEKAREKQDKEYNRFYWRLVRLWDSLRGRPS